jgi:hypothetical protein
MLELQALLIAGTCSSGDAVPGRCTQGRASIEGCDLLVGLIREVLHATLLIGGLGLAYHFEGLLLSLRLIVNHWSSMLLILNGSDMLNILWSHMLNILLLGGNMLYHLLVLWLMLYNLLVLDWSLYISNR